MAMDPEFLALQRMFKIMDALSPDAAMRVLHYCQERTSARYHSQMRGLTQSTASVHPILYGANGKSDA